MRRWAHAYIRIRVHRLRRANGGPPELHRSPSRGMSPLRRQAPEAVLPRGDRVQRLGFLRYRLQEELERVLVLGFVPFALFVHLQGRLELDRNRIEAERRQEELVR